MTNKCDGCGIERQLPCSTALQGSLLFTCREKREKFCSLCKLNNITVPCFVTNGTCDRDCKAKLSCGHEASWVCGKDPDPRLDDAVLCRFCVIPQWEAAVAHEPSEECIEQFRLDIYTKISSLFRETMVLEQLNPEADIKPLLAARKKIFNNYLSLLKGDVRFPAAHAPPLFGSAEDFSSYHVVFKDCPMKTKNGEAIKNTDFVLKELYTKLKCMDGTIMGRGHLLMQLTNVDALGSCFKLEDEYIKICIGVAYVYKEYMDSTPFRVTNEKKENMKSNEKAKRLQSKGYDFVAIDPSKRRIKDIEERVYWESGVVLPVGVYTLRVKSSCIICGDYFGRREGFFCTNNHFICWENCFEAYVDSAGQPDAIKGSLDAEGNLRCPECKESYHPHRIALNGPPTALDSLLALKMKLNTLREGPVFFFLN